MLWLSVSGGAGAGAGAGADEGVGHLNCNRIDVPANMELNFFFHCGSSWAVLIGVQMVADVSITNALYRIIDRRQC